MDGCAIVGPLCVILCDIYIAKMEDDRVEKLFTFYKCYVDDNLSS